MKTQVKVGHTRDLTTRITNVWALMKAQVTALVSLTRGFAARIN